MNWLTASFSELSGEQVYDLLKLRSDVFVVEQNCVYADMDDVDKHSQVIHLCGHENNTLLAYARVIPPGITYDVCSIGRVVTHFDYRDKKLGHQLIQRSLKLCAETWPNQPIKIGAQAHLTKFYEKHGFQVYSEVYLEDGIPHVDMIIE